MVCIPQRLSNEGTLTAINDHVILTAFKLSPMIVKKRRGRKRSRRRRESRRHLERLPGKNKKESKEKTAGGFPHPFHKAFQRKSKRKIIISFRFLAFFFQNTFSFFFFFLYFPTFSLMIPIFISSAPSTMGDRIVGNIFLGDTNIELQ